MAEPLLVPYVGAEEVSKIAYRPWTKIILPVLVLAFVAALALACSGETSGGPGVNPEADPEAGGEPGVVEPPPPGATQVEVTLQEWAVIPEVDSIRAGETYFLADNVGPNDSHELVVIRTDLAADELPTENGKVLLDEVDTAGLIEPFSPRSQASKVLNLEPGNYVLICNIAEVEDGEVESHYQEGMFVTFTVEK